MTLREGLLGDITVGLSGVQILGDISSETLSTSDNHLCRYLTVERWNRQSPLHQSPEPLGCNLSNVLVPFGDFSFKLYLHSPEHSLQQCRDSGTFIYLICSCLSDSHLSACIHERETSTLLHFKEWLFNLEPHHIMHLFGGQTTIQVLKFILIVTIIIWRLRPVIQVVTLMKLQ